MARDWLHLPKFQAEEDAAVVAPEGWGTRQIEDIFDKLEIGKRFDQKTSFASGKVPVVDQSADGFVGYHDEQPGVVASKTSPVITFANHTCEMRVMRRPFSVIQNVFPMVGRLGVCETLFFYYATKGRVHLEEYKGHYPDFRRLWINLPPLAEQKAIAAVLGALDDKIELNRRMNATLEAMARALFQSWFVDFDPVRAKLDGRPPAALDPATAALFPDSFHDSPLGHIPTGWNAIPLYDTAQWVNGAAFKNEDFCAPGKGLPVIKIAELKDGIGAQTKWCQRDAGADKIIDTGDLVYSWSGSPDTSLEAFLWSGGRGLLNQHIFKVISATVAEKRFVYYLLQYLRPVLVETARNKQTTGLGHVTIADMKRLQVCMPNKAVLAAFDRNVAPIFDKAFTNTLESRALATLRDTLLPKLLSGELSVAETLSKSL